MATKKLKGPKEFKIIVPIEITRGLISDVLCSAFENNGIRYWAVIKSMKKPKMFQFRSDDEKIYKHLDYPLNPGGNVIITDIEAKVPKDYVINLQTLQKGLVAMAIKNPKHFAEITKEDFDADTADILIQCCCFGESIYG